MCCDTVCLLLTDVMCRSYAARENRLHEITKIIKMSSKTRGQIFPMRARILVAKLIQAFCCKQIVKKRDRVNSIAAIMSPIEFIPNSCEYS